ncbi:MAG TPA: alpha/beta fold hydrolase [Phycisphaerae bacterium]|nr:alpha/beta fold hydrolase [Phycisphaerales bacterium]HRX87297.1 alpha/beta fold hydrolase [Phycisphaerae bacterium]
MQALDERTTRLYPFAPHTFDLDGLRMHYVDEGAGEVIVCVHGNPTWSFYYRNLIADLRRDHRVVAPDHIGCGRSDKPGDDRYPYRLERRIGDLERLLDHLGLDANLTLVVHDWGGMIGAGVACRRPERIARMVILNTAAFLLPAGKNLPLRLAFIRDTPLATLAVRGFNAFARGALHMAVADPMRPDVQRGYLAPYDSWENRIATLRFVQDIPLAPGDASYAAARWVDDHLARLADIPKLICWGARDFVFDDAFLAEWRRRFPGAEVHRFADAGHYVLEDAGDRIIPLVRDFLARHPLGAAASPAEATS